ncbi:hypothetical protein BVI434_1860016 [Burkholderia vietnamiensis]|nr:hypothetical protein BVI434_1860016 [Burkholderia vietnamiensis]
MPLCLAVACTFSGSAWASRLQRPRDPLIAPRLPETPLYRLAFQSFPSLRLFPNLSSAPSLTLIILDTYLWIRIVVSFCSLLA